MTLLETIKKATAGGNEVTIPAATSFPVVLNGEEASCDLTSQDGHSNDGSLIKHVVGFKIPDSDFKKIQEVDKLVKTLKRRMKNKNSLDRGLFMEILRSMPENKLGEVVGGELIGLLVDGCVVLGLWEVLKSFICSSLIRRIGQNNLVEKLVEKNKSDLLCLYVNQVQEIRVSEMHRILQYFLSPPRESRDGMIKVRDEWRRQAILAIEKASQKGLPDEVMVPYREASIMLMMAHDGFSSSELCLHSLFSSQNLGELIMSSAISRLGSSELMNLVNYLRKWLDKYERFPEICPSSEAGATLGLNFCKLIPSIESVTRRLSMVIDEHYSYLVLNSQFHDEMNSIRQIVESLVLSAGLCSSVANAIENLRQTL